MAITYIPNDTFPTTRTNLNTSFNAAFQNNAGAVAPTSFEAYTPWLDTSVSPAVLKIRNAANTAWIDYDDFISALKTTTDVSGYPWVLDEDNMASDDDTKTATQQSIKAYVDSKVGAGNWIILEDQKSSGTGGGSTTTNSVNTRDLNTEVSDPNSNVTVAANQFTLTAGNYGLITVDSMFFRCDQAQLYLYDVTNATYLAIGNCWASDSEVDQANVTLKYHIGTLGVNTTYEIRYICAANNSGASNALGVPVLSAVTGEPGGVYEVYTQVVIQDLN